MLKENVKDTGEIIETILTQPLSIPGAKTDVSLIQAANHYDSTDAMTSDFRKILLSFLQFPEPTDTLLRELEILKEELALK